MAWMLLPHLNATYSYISLAIIAILTFYAGKYHRLVCAKQYRPILRWRLLRAMVLGPIPSMPKKDDQIDSLPHEQRRAISPALQESAT